jgi:hypothetical protein
MIFQSEFLDCDQVTIISQSGRAQNTSAVRTVRN